MVGPQVAGIKPQSVECMFAKPRLCTAPKALPYGIKSQILNCLNHPFLHVLKPNTFRHGLQNSIVAHSNQRYSKRPPKSLSPPTQQATNQCLHFHLRNHAPRVPTRRQLRHRGKRPQWQLSSPSPNAAALGQ